MPKTTVYEGPLGWCFRCEECGNCGGNYADREKADQMSKEHEKLMH